jgi:allantoin racemase
MRILVVNPNTTESMTALIRECARAAVGPGALVDAVNPASGPVAIESHVDEVLAAPGVVQAVRDGERDGYDGFVVACFGDPGLDAAREVATGPVVGIAEAGLRTATYLGRSFSVVTTLRRVVGPTRDLVRRYGLVDQCAGIHACEIPVLGLGDPASAEVLAGACLEALATDGSEVLVLGCAGMADMVPALTDRLGVPVVDGVAAATATVASLIRLSLRTSRLGEYAPPVRPAGRVSI